MDSQWPRFEVIKQDTPTSPPQLVGSVHAADVEHALVVARHVFVRRPAAYALFVAPAEAVYHTTEAPPEAEPSAPGAYWVFAKPSHRRSMVYGDLVGRFEAPSPAAAIAQARQQSQGVAFWAVPEALIRGTEASNEVIASWFAPAADKRYRLQSAYGFITARKVRDA
jgi:ring-1,2-phenylacetyl-CoA epoxidase subunit PaaB